MSAPLLPIVVAVSLRLPGGPTPPSADPAFGADKAKHFFVSVLAQSLGYGTLRALRVGHAPALAGATGATLALGVAREVHDRRAGKTFSVRDLAWDAAGAGAASVLLSQTVR